MSDKVIEMILTSSFAGSRWAFLIVERHVGQNIPSTLPLLNMYKNRNLNERKIRVHRGDEMALVDFHRAVYQLFDTCLLLARSDRSSLIGDNDFSAQIGICNEQTFLSLSPASEKN